MARGVELVDEATPVADQIVLDVAEAAVLDDDEQLALVHVFGAGAEQVDDVEVRAHVDHDFQFGLERFQRHLVSFGAHHLDGHRRHRLGADADGFGFEDATEGSGAELFAQFQPLSGKLPLAVVGQQIRLLVDAQLRIDAARIALAELVQLAVAEERPALLLAQFDRVIQLKQSFSASRHYLAAFGSKIKTTVVPFLCERSRRPRGPRRKGRRPVRRWRP